MKPAEKAELALRMVREAPVLSFDTETSGVDWKRNYPVGYVFCDSSSRSIYVPIRHGGGGNLPDPDGNVETPTEAQALTVPHRFERALAEAFRERSERGMVTVGHNLKFDCHFALNAGVALGRALSCTQTNEALLDEYAKSYSLDACCKRRDITAKLGEGLYTHLSRMFGIPDGRGAMSHFWQLPGNDPVAVEYAEGDGVSTIELYFAQVDELREQKLDVVWELENELIWTLVRMERRGIAVDTSYLEALVEDIRDRVEQARLQLPASFNPRSPTDVRAVVEGAGRTDWPITAKGNPSFTEKFLSSFPEGQHIVDLRKWTNLENSFVRPLIDTHVYEGRVHAQINQLKTDELGTAARLSCSSPNLQQVPKRDKPLAKKFRRAFVADEGMVLYEGDYSQCEPRLFTHYSADPALVEGYNRNPPRDMHGTVAEMLKVERDPTAKRMNMGMLTGMFPKTFSGHMGWDLERATAAWNQWRDSFPKVGEFQDTAKAVLKRRGYVRTLIGRRGRLEHPRFAYRGVSKIIQGSNADIIKWKLLQIDKELERRGDDAYLFMSIHDSILWQAPDSEAGRELSEWIVRTMEDVQSEPFNLRVPFVVDVGRGPDWATASFGED